MPTITVREGDCIASIAERFGLLPETVWNDPANSELKALRKDPNVLMPGDEVFVRRKEMKEVPVATGKRHRFRRKGYPHKFTLELFDNDDEPLAGLSYILEIDGDTFSGEIDGEGKIEVWVPIDARRGTLTIENGDEYELQFGYLDPVTEEAGVRDRLKNLGYLSSVKASDDDYRAAIRMFQREYDLEDTGEMDKATQDKLLEVHGT